MKRWISVAILMGAVVAGSGSARAQSNSLVPRRGKVDTKQTIPKGQLPPPGMCRIWISDVPADKQPAPTDCATAIKNRPSNGRVVFGDDEDSRARDRRERDAKDEKRADKRKPKKP